MKVTVRNPQFTVNDRYFFEVSEFITYDGDEVKCGKWENPNEVLCLTTGIDYFPVRSIQRKWIHSIDGNSVLHIPKQNKAVSKLVQGSNGKVYEVTDHSCTCPGFTFRGSCKHIGVKE